ncbi:uncharacterized protein C16C10.8 [Neocloeon triangulifer]|uniref:uncharacterized protein C16C10.8 n=1 Tax=Neocloeon triangulifer TaxID=2078957 RepID=UPI00286F498A|nr:uncharacterized protein C16C10.8 [Neocloeon triangulifer]
MVYFICNNCGDSLKKNQVDQHLTKFRCKGCSVSCMDCHRDFDSKSYVQHNKCISEQEKYSGGNFTQKVATTNKLDKRGNWVRLISEVANRKDPNRSRYVQDMLSFLDGKETVPNKEKPFMNFISTGPSHLRDQRTASQVWMLLFAELEKERKNQLRPAVNGNSKNINETPQLKVETSSAEAPKGNSKDGLWKKAIKRLAKGGSEFAPFFKLLSKMDVPTETKTAFKKFVKKNVPESHHVDLMWKELEEEYKKIENTGEKEGKKRAATGDEESKEPKRAKLNGSSPPIDESGTVCEEPLSLTKGGKFPWKKAVLKVLKSSKSNTMSMKKLKKKVTAEYEKLGLDSSDSEKMEIKFTQAIGKIPTVLLQKESREVVLLVSEK